MSASDTEQQHQQPPSAGPRFEVARNGYHTEQVDRWVHGAMAKLDETQRALGLALKTQRGQQTIGELIQLAADEVTGRRSKAEEDITQLRQQAAMEAAEAVAAGKREAESLLEAAKEQVGTLLADARSEATKMLDEAGNRAAAVKDGAERRLEALITGHEETVRRLTEISAVTGRMLSAESERGNLREEVERAGAGTSAVAAESPRARRSG